MPRSAKPWFVYLIECRDGSLYTGATVDVAARYAKHVAGKGARYTRSRPPLRVIAVIEARDRGEALRTEHAIKQLAAPDKRALARRHPPSPMPGAGSTPPARPARRNSPAVPPPTGDPRMLRIGDQAPAFTLTSDSGRTVDSSHLKGRRYLLYFYPKDDTPGCTKEACAFRDQLPAFEGLDVPVFGVSADNERAHARFVARHGLNFPLLADPEHQLLEAYGTWVEKSMYGRKYMGIQRCTFLVGHNGRIEQVWDKVSPERHPADVLAWLRGDRPAASGPTGDAAPAKATRAGTRASPKKAGDGKMAKAGGAGSKPAKAASSATKTAGKSPAAKAGKTPSKATPTKANGAKVAPTRKRAPRKAG